MYIGDFASRQAARVPTQDGRFATDLIGSFSKAGQAAQAFLVQNRRRRHTTHFHGSNQFQFFIGGSGKFVRHDIGVGSVHYADAYTSYGPIVSGVSGLDFLTLRHTPITRRTTCRGRARAAAIRRQRCHLDAQHGVR